MLFRTAVGAAVILLALSNCARTSLVPSPTLVSSATSTSLAASCKGRDGWSDPAPPGRIATNLFYVGTCGITSLLITSNGGHVLIDGATEEAAPQIIANIRSLGFNPRDVRYLLSSHEHVDHVGGLAALKRLTGARTLARAEARKVLESGAVDPTDPQSGAIPGFKGVKIDRAVRDGEAIRLGSLTLTAHATPGHTAGSTSWTWLTCATAATCRTVVYADSLSAVSADGFRFIDHPELVAPFRATFAKVERLRCDILVTPHPGASNLFERLAGRAPLIDPRACAAYAATARRRLDERLAREAAP